MAGEARRDRRAVARRANERYHDRIAGRYDGVYDTPYWRFYREISWRHLARFLPSARPARAADLGCGTGYFGLRLLKAGMEVAFVDLSRNMLEEAKARVEGMGGRFEGKSRFVKADLEDLGEIGDGSVDVAVLQGDPLSFCGNPRKALAEVARVVAPGGVMVASVDHVAAAPAAYLERGDVEGLAWCLRTGRTVWLADRKEERFPTRMFGAEELGKWVEAAGFEVLSVVGKTCLVQRRHERLLEEGKVRRRLMALEEMVHGRASFLGLASHLQVAGRRG